MKVVIDGARAVATFATAAIAVETHSTFGRPHRVDNGPHTSCRIEYARACAVTAMPAATSVEPRSSAITGTSGRMMVRSRHDQKIRNGSRKPGARNRASAPGRPAATSPPDFATSLRGVEVGLRVTDARERAVHREVAPATGDEQVLGGELRDDLAAVLRHDDLFLDARRAPAVRRGPVRLEREHHALLEHLRVLERGEPREDRLLPDRQTHAVPVLERERGLLVREAELLRLGPQLHDVRRGGARTHRRDRDVHVLARDL